MSIIAQPIFIAVYRNREGEMTVALHPRRKAAKVWLIEQAENDGITVEGRTMSVAAEYGKLKEMELETSFAVDIYLATGWGECSIT